MKKILSILFVYLMVFSCVNHAAASEVSSEIVFSDEVKAVLLADKALEEKYGITLTMQTYFERAVSRQEDGSMLVIYRNPDEFAYVLGDYRATVRDDRAEITWSHDGETTEGAFYADAWGKEQIETMLQYNAENDLSGLLGYVDAINEKHGIVTAAPVLLTEEELKQKDLLWRQAVDEIKGRRKLSPKTMADLARQAVALAYDLTEDQQRLLVVENDEPRENPDDGWLYTFVNDQPCYCVCFSMTQKPAAGIYYLRLEWTEKDGLYRVYVNVESGVIERILYESGLGGNG